MTANDLLIQFADVVETLNLELASTNLSASDRVIELNLVSTVDVRNDQLSLAEAYVLQVQAQQQRVTVTGTRPAGVFYGLQTLLSLLAGSSDGRTLRPVGGAAVVGLLCCQIVARYSRVDRASDL